MDANVEDGQPADGMEPCGVPRGRSVACLTVRVLQVTKHWGCVRVSHPRYSSDEIVRRGQALYEERIHAAVEPGHEGKFLVVDIETGEYEIDADDLAALQRARSKNPDAALYIVRVGHRAAYRIGGSSLRPGP